MLRRVLATLAGLLLWAGSHAQSGSFEQGLLWEISRPGIAPSHLFGTMHIADPRVLTLTPAVEKAFMDAHTFVLELYPDEAATLRFSQASLLEGQERLSQLVPPATFDLLVRHLAEHGIKREVADRLKPWAATQISAEHRGTRGDSLDVALYLRARVANKRIEELNSIDELIAIFDSLPRDTQIALLQRALEHHAIHGDELEESIGAYLRGDLSALDALAWRDGGGRAGEPSHYARFEKRLIQDRSILMAQRLQPHLQRGKAFVAIGALHLYGNRGILKLLQDEGWTVLPLR